jgi:hypothetical protein
MKQEEKDLLIKDLCARLPYGVKISIPDLWIHDRDIEILDEIFKGDDGLYKVNSKGQLIEHIKPYLFPISSMTEEQKKQYYALADDVTIEPGTDSHFGIKIHCIKLGISDNPHEGLWDCINLDAINWLLKNNFDIYGLIPMDLAIDATGLNIY